MSDWDAELTFLEPQYSEKDNLNRGRRLSLRQIEVTARVRKDGKRTSRSRYRFTFGVGDDGTVRVTKIDRPNDADTIHAHTMSLCLAEAEAAVAEWCRNEDPVNLAVQSLASYLDARGDADAAPVTNEAAAREDADT